MSKFPLQLFIVIVLITGGGAKFTHAEQAAAMPRSGSACPSGYYKSGEYCVPGKDATKAVLQRKGSSCPSGYYKSGEYCVASGDKTKAALERVGRVRVGDAERYYRTVKLGAGLVRTEVERAVGRSMVLYARNE